jgi:hypothetical protein
MRHDAEQMKRVRIPGPIKQDATVASLRIHEPALSVVTDSLSQQIAHVHVLLPHGRAAAAL